MHVHPARGSSPARHRWTLHHAQRAAFRLSLVLLTVAGALLVTLWAGLTSAPTARAATVNATATATFYGADTSRTVAAISAIWPQYSGAYCGIATAEAVVNYDDEVHGVGMYFTGRSAQYTVAANNRSAGASRWGYATPVNQYAGVTNIAPDFGTDPRSIAYMEYTYTPNNTFFHDYIYRWQFSNGGQPSFYTQVQQATTSMARALTSWHEPVNVTINAGMHSVLVTGVYAYTNPATTYPAQLASVVYRDPMASPTASRFQVDFSTWAGGNFSTPAGVYSLWSRYYGNGYDPEPSVGIYRPYSGHPVHWFLGFTWIQRDNNYANGTYSPDFAYTSTGALMTAP